MTFAWPLALLGLTSLLVPIVLHLLQRGHGKRVTIGSIRWLQDDTKPRWRKLRPSQIPLLLARLALLATLVFILAKPLLPERWMLSSQNLTLVHPSVPVNSELVQAQSGEKRWLAPGFPKLEQAPELGTAQSWSLLQEIDAAIDPSREIQVVAPVTLDNLALKKPYLRRNVKWTVWDHENTPIGPMWLAKTVQIVHGSDGLIGANAVAVAVRAWQAAGIVVEPNIVHHDTLSENEVWTIWLSEQDIPDSITGTILTYKSVQNQIPFDSHTSVAASQGRRIITWPDLQYLGSAQEKPGVAEQLIRIFRQHHYQPTPSSLVSQQQATPWVDELRAFTKNPTGQIPNWALPLLLLFFVTERVLSLFYERRR